MKLTNRGIVFECYRNASPSREYCSFTDTDGATLIIKTSTLVRMFELVKFDLERNGAREYVLNTGIARPSREYLNTCLDADVEKKQAD